MAEKIKYQRLGPAGFPWNPDHPLVFHVLTSATGKATPSPSGGVKSPYAVLTKALLEDRSLKPIATRRKLEEKFWGTGEAVTMSLGKTDQQSGDDAWLFFTPHRTVDGCTTELEPGLAALAYDYDEWAAMGEIGWRPLDVIAPVDSTVRYAELTYKNRDTRLENTRKMLRILTDCLTVKDRGLIRELVRLDGLALGGDSTALARADKLLEPYNRRAMEKVTWLPRDYEQMDRDLAAGKPYLTPSCMMMLHTSVGPNLTQNLTGDGDPELLLAGEARLRAARWYVNAKGAWEAMPRRW